MPPQSNWICAVCGLFALAALPMFINVRLQSASPRGRRLSLQPDHYPSVLVVLLGFDHLESIQRRSHDAQELSQISGGVFRYLILPGQLDYLLGVMERAELLVPDPTTETSPSKKSYRITPAGSLWLEKGPPLVRPGLGPPPRDGTSA